ncbi:hypothetical protein BH09PSE6_BH09PSE6_12320 [soil metagenome]
MNAKIDAIESEMAGEFSPPMARDGMPRKATPVPKGVTLPSTVRHEPPPSTIMMGDNVHTRGGPPTLPPLEIGTDIAMGSSTEIDVIEAVGLAPIVEEAAIFFANGQQEDCERALKDAIASDASNRDAWLLLFALLQQTQQSREFEALAVDYSVKFESSPPAWRAGNAMAPVRAGAVRAVAADAQSVQLPTSLDAMAVREFDQVKRQLKHSHRARLSFEGVLAADEVGAQLALDLLHGTAATTQELTLTGVEPAVHAMRERLVAGQRDQPESVWLLTLELYRLLGWDRQYEDLSVDYSISFEVSPPQQDRRPSNIIAGQTPARSAGRPADEALECLVPTLRGDITGKADEAITSLDVSPSDIAEGQRVEVDCGGLGRVDFAAAGALLNWLVAAESRGRKYVFRDVNQLVAALFRVMGIDTVVEVQRRKA